MNEQKKILFWPYFSCASFLEFRAECSRLWLAQRASPRRGTAHILVGNFNPLPSELRFQLGYISREEFQINNLDNQGIASPENCDKVHDISSPLTF